MKPESYKHNGHILYRGQTVLISTEEILNDQIIRKTTQKILAEHFLTLISLHPSQ